MLETAGKSDAHIGSQTANPNMCTPFWENVQNGDLIGSTTPLVETKNSSDLEWGRRPELKSGDTFRFTLPNPKGLVSEIISILVEIARRLCYHLLGFEVAVVRVVPPWLTVVLESVVYICVTKRSFVTCAPGRPLA